MKNTKKLKNKEFSVKLSQYEWIWYAKSYLSLARIGIEELKRQNYIRKISFEFRFSYENKHLLIPIIYNLKHAIEIIVKSLKIQIDKKIIKSHNIFNLYNALQESIKKIGLKIEKPDKLKELAQIIEKYYKLEFWNRKLIIDASVLDSQNDIFRFPDNSANFILNLEDLKKISQKEMGELLDDIKKIDSLLGIIREKIKKAKNPEMYKTIEKQENKNWHKMMKTMFKDYN